MAEPISTGALIGLSAASAAFSGGASLGVSAVKNRRSYKYTKKLLAEQEKYRKLAFQDSVDFWKQQNEYDNPLNQTSRLRSAGLSPLSEFGVQGSQGLSSVQGVDASQFQADGARLPSIDLAQLAMQKQSLDADVELKNADAKAREAEARLKNSQAVEQEWKNTLQPLFEREREALVSKIESEAAKSAVEAAWADYMAAMQAALASGDLELKQKASKEFDARIDELKSRKLLNEADAEAARSSARKMDAETQTENESRPYKIDAIIRENARKTSETALNWYKSRVLGPSEKERIDADTAEAKARARKVDAEIERLGKENNYTDAQIEYLKHLRKIGWWKFAVSTALSVSAEARGWFKEGSKAGAASGWAIDDEALGAIAATL